MEKAVEVEAKAGLQPTFYIQEIDHWWQQGNCPVHAIIIKVQTKENLTKNSKNKKINAKAQKPWVVSSNNHFGSMKVSKKSRKEKKEKYLMEK